MKKIITKSPEIMIDHTHNTNIVNTEAKKMRFKPFEINKGVYIGIDKNASHVIIDPLPKKNLKKNFNKIILGTLGAGMSYSYKPMVDSEKSDDIL